MEPYELREYMQGCEIQAKKNHSRHKLTEPVVAIIRVGLFMYYTKGCLMSCLNVLVYSSKNIDALAVLSNYIYYMNGYELLLITQYA